MEFLWAPKRDTENNRPEPPLHLSWCGNFVDLPETLRKLRLSTNLPHQEIWWKYCILHSALPAWPNFCNPCFRRFSYICIYWNTVLLMTMSQNWGYESRFDVIISSQPYWNYHGFLSPLGNWCLGEQKKFLNCHLLGGTSTLADTMMRLCLLTINETYQIKTREKFSGKVVLFI